MYRAALKHSSRLTVARSFPIAQRRALSAASSSKQDEEKLPPSIVEQLKLDDPTRYVPLTIATFGTLTGTGILHMNEELQILGLFALFVGTVYTKLGDTIGKALDESADAVLKEANLLEDAQIIATQSVIAAHKRQMHIAADIEAIFKSQKDVSSAIVASQSLRLKHEIRGMIVKRLDALASAEASVAAGLHSAVVKKASKTVRAAFTKGDKTLKKGALDAALEALKKPTAAVKKDLVGELYGKQIVQFREKLLKAKGVSQELSPKQLAKVTDGVKAAQRRDALEGLKVKIPTKYTIDALL